MSLLVKKRSHGRGEMRITIFGRTILLSSCASIAQVASAGRTLVSTATPVIAPSVPRSSQSIPSMWKEAGGKGVQLTLALVDEVHRERIVNAVLLSGRLRPAL